MPASEFQEWQAYFSIYPFSQDREDARIAMLAAVIANVSGKTLKKAVSEIDFQIDYLKERKRPVPVKRKSIEQQRREAADFKKRYEAAQKESYKCDLKN